eukprot:SAG31_NODE_17071_length_684_cov_1.405128_2_plen_116_part_00
MDCCCPHRSPSLWVARGNPLPEIGQDAGPETGENGGLHYDSCVAPSGNYGFGSGSGVRYSGVVQGPSGGNFFRPGVYVHVVWVKIGSRYTFYRNGVQLQGDSGDAAPPQVNMNQL